ncbi:P-loop NTPase fold protein [Helicobacter rodentium]|uniref:P-loop NTPase fold protein n=1 Tax=Helicobacter rodentium TaxID=59617 RepID=UPI00068F1F6E|nr:P-loop NTPase fold protein [Helicobacter rodentium]
MCSTYDIENKKNNKALKIAEFLIENKIENVCLAIQGAWGAGKTYLWKEVEKEIEKINKEKQVVYIDLFGKESYKQILEEIVLKVNGIHNEVLEKAAKFTSGAIKLIVPAVPKNINLDSIFSIFKKEDFENIIVCFDNIERKSDKLPLDEILGLVNLLKEDKSCNVVMIFNKDELDKQELNNQKEQKANRGQESSSSKVEHPKNWYETYKEKIIDYETIIDNNDEIARKIIEKNLKCNIEEIKQDVAKLILECFKQKLNNNLRLLIKITQHINYFNKECFMQFYNYKEREIFIDTLRIHYQTLFDEVMKYYSIKSDDKNGIVFLCYKKYFNNFCNLEQQELEILKNDFKNSLKNEIRTNFEKYKDKYLFGNLNDKEFAKYIEYSFPKFNNYVKDNGMNYSIGYYQHFFNIYEKIIGKELDCKKDIEKSFIEALVKYEFNLSAYHAPFYKDFYQEIEKFKENNQEYKQYYQKLKEEKYQNKNIESFLAEFEKITSTFTIDGIKRYNQYPFKDIAEYFQKDNEFCQEFSIFFSNLTVSGIEKYNLENNLFLGYQYFLNKKENKIKKENVLITLKSQEHDCILLRLLEKNNLSS